MLSSRSGFRLNDQMRFDWELPLLLRPAGVVRGGMGPACPFAGRAPGEHRAGATEDDQSVATFKLNVNLVDVFFTVKDKQGNLVPHLTKDDCTITEDKVPQTLKSFVAETSSR
jgi:hypothetical protein